ncbi:MAG TPA: hypothetical protein VFM34_01350 [Moraxellaceae bacterium]|nr:hypothetical protein [Moraxellaceae bacterium]
MRFQGPALAALLFGMALATPSAQALELDPDTLSGLVVGAGQAHTRYDNSGFGTALFVDANYIHVFLNGGVSHKAWDTSVTNGYLGIGISGLLQLQVGEGTEGPVRRIRSDINISRMVDFFAGRRRNRYNQSFGSKITFTFAAEEYSQDRRFDNFQAGLGLIF